MGIHANMKSLPAALHSAADEFCRHPQVGARVWVRGYLPQRWVVISLYPYSKGRGDEAKHTPNHYAVSQDGRLGIVRATSGLFGWPIVIPVPPEIISWHALIDGLNEARQKFQHAADHRPGEPIRVYLPDYAS